eukprot:gene13204-biopygen20012
MRPAARARSGRANDTDELMEKCWSAAPQLTPGGVRYGAKSREVGRRPRILGRHGTAAPETGAGGPGEQTGSPVQAGTTTPVPITSMRTTIQDQGRRARWERNCGTGQRAPRYGRRRGVGWNPGTEVHIPGRG